MNPAIQAAAAFCTEYLLDLDNLKASQFRDALVRQFELKLDNNGGQAFTMTIGAGSAFQQMIIDSCTEAGIDGVVPKEDILILISADEVEILEEGKDCWQTIWPEAPQQPPATPTPGAGMTTYRKRMSQRLAEVNQEIQRKVRDAHDKGMAAFSQQTITALANLPAARWNNLLDRLAQAEMSAHMAAIVSPENDPFSQEFCEAAVIAALNQAVQEELSRPATSA